MHSKNHSDYKESSIWRQTFKENDEGYNENHDVVGMPIAVIHKEV